MSKEINPVNSGRGPGRPLGSMGKAKATPKGNKSAKKPVARAVKTAPDPSIEAYDGQQRLPDEARRFIVESNACLRRPAEVAKDVKVRFGFELSSSHVEKYDPTKANGQNLCQEYRDLFRSVRLKYQEEIRDIGLADQKQRLLMLDKMAMEAYERGNLGLASALMEQIAKDSGGAFTNARIMSGAVSVVLTREQRQDRLKQILQEAARKVSSGEKSDKGKKS